MKELINDRSFSNKAPEQWGDRLLERGISGALDVSQNCEAPYWIAAPRSSGRRC
ncbi:MAG: hypothetical protein ACLQPH_10245 [Acidimicrobiales bacterium]